MILGTTVLYVIGFIGVWIWCKRLRNAEDHNDWSDVGLTLLFSVFWPISIIIFLLVDIKLSKPPKWL